MATLTGSNTRTITGYVITLLDYPRWIIEREVDFTNCNLGGGFDEGDTQCSSCRFGIACCWLNTNRNVPQADATLDELLQALRTSVDYLRSLNAKQERHAVDCECDTCQWLREATGFLRQHRHRT